MSQRKGKKQAAKPPQKASPTAPDPGYPLLLGRWDVGSYDELREDFEFWCVTVLPFALAVLTLPWWLSWAFDAVDGWFGASGTSGQFSGKRGKGLLAGLCCPAFALDSGLCPADWFPC